MSASGNRRSKQPSWCSGKDLDCKCVQKANGLKPLIGREGRKDMERRHDATSILVNCSRERRFCATLTVKEIGARKERRNFNEQQNGDRHDGGLSGFVFSLKICKTILPSFKKPLYI